MPRGIISPMTATVSVIAALAFFLMPVQTPLFDAELNPVVFLPAGYFVLQTDGEQKDGYVCVIYDDITGYVKADAVTAVDYTPVTKYETTVTFTCDNDGQAVNLRAAPQRAAAVLTVLDPSASGHAYGTITGDALIDGAGNTWYYVNAGGTRGYCYAAHVKVTPTPPNIIEKEPPDDEEPAPPVNAEPKNEFMNITTAIIFIVALCVPVPFIMFYLFRRPKEDK